MSNDDISEAPPSYAPCAAVRITPYDGDHPDHDQAVTYRFGTPITFVHVYRTRHPYLGTTVSRDEQQMPGLVGFTVPEDHEEADTALAVAQGLWQRRGTYVAVDLWSRSPHGYLYALVPFWKRLDLDEHPGLPERPEHRTVALGESCPAPRPVLWPRSVTEPGPYSVEPGVQMLLSTDVDPPPPAGFPAPTRTTGQRTAS
ncbi:hypothetical protein RVR_4432 [Actinacidiphila reveromycinica]|uniref:Uncharacterized protein n=1 Tax=Actinacidiphila reveromycinica TaxID=659352 RepID=A0A7U3VP38_9ACTN|nr:hypothetical protein [Streptomyces sp. SN-593]BBA98300.1 hypothetical protein RVR_4432 [Streptomyces sp. SN-593]